MQFFQDSSENTGKTTMGAKIVIRCPVNPVKVDGMDTKTSGFDSQHPGFLE